jgi:hypothetical protein
MSIVHPVVCSLFLNMIVDVADIVRWRAGRSALAVPFNGKALLWNGKALLWNGKFLIWRP